jgi:hypothetical protein
MNDKINAKTLYKILRLSYFMLIIVKFVIFFSKNFSRKNISIKFAE